MLFFTNIKTTFGVIQIVTDEKDVVEVHFLGSEFDEEHTSRLTIRAKNQLLEYLSGNRRAFALPLCPKCSAFAKSVYDATLAIPFGETRSYHDIAVSLGIPKGDRAVGNALAKNPIPIFIPCHRVIGSDRVIGNYIGGNVRKTRLLEIENHLIRNGKIFSRTE